MRKKKQIDWEELDLELSNMLRHSRKTKEERKTLAKVREALQICERWRNHFLEIADDEVPCPGGVFGELQKLVDEMR